MKTKQTDTLSTVLAEALKSSNLSPSTVGKVDDHGNTPASWEVLDAEERAKAIKEKSDKKNEERSRREEIKKKEAMDAVIKERQKQRNTKASYEYPNPYYAGPQVGLFIGDTWVSDVVTISYTETVNKVPLYGYASTHFNAVAKGTVLVQGQFAIAYTQPNYLQTILARYSTSEGRLAMFPTQISDPIEKAKKLFWKLEDLQNTVNLTPLEYGYEYGVTGQVRNGFDIRVFYGASEFVTNSVLRRASIYTGADIKTKGVIEEIKNVHLTSRGLSVTPSGEPIAEIYSFFASHVQTSGKLTPGTRTIGVSVDASTGLVPIANVNSNNSVNQRYINNLKGR
jgi:hypothetical protein